MAAPRRFIKYPVNLPCLPVLLGQQCCLIPTWKGSILNQSTQQPPGSDPYQTPESDLTGQPEAGYGGPIDHSTLASRGARLGASLLDTIIMLAIMIPLLWLVGYWSRALTADVSLLETLFWATVSLGIWAAVNGSFLIRRGQTIGKMALDIQIVSAQSGELLPLQELVLRRMAPFTYAAQLPFVGPFAGLVNVLFIFRSDKRCVHDFLAGTIVREYVPVDGSARGTLAS